MWHIGNAPETFLLWIMMLFWPLPSSHARTTLVAGFSVLGTYLVTVPFCSPGRNAWLVTCLWAWLCHPWPHVGTWVGANGSLWGAANFSTCVYSTAYGKAKADNCKWRLRSCSWFIILVHVIAEPSSFIINSLRPHLSPSFLLPLPPLYHQTKLSFVEQIAYLSCVFTHS